MAQKGFVWYGAGAETQECQWGAKWADERPIVRAQGHLQPEKKPKHWMMVLLILWINGYEFYRDRAKYKSCFRKRIILVVLK